MDPFSPHITNDVNFLKGANGLWATLQAAVAGVWKTVIVAFRREKPFVQKRSAGRESLRILSKHLNQIRNSLGSRGFGSGFAFSGRDFFLNRESNRSENDVFTSLGVDFNAFRKLKSGGVERLAGFKLGEVD